MDFQLESAYTKSAYTISNHVIMLISVTFLTVYDILELRI